MVKGVFRWVVILFGLQATIETNAQNKVVVIPVAGSDVAMAQQHFSFSEVANSAVSEANMCTTDIFTTPSQATQVLLLANASARFSANGAFWNVTIEVEKDAGGWGGISGGSARAGKFLDSWSQISAMAIHNLAPNSAYQFRVKLSGGATNFAASRSEYCDLLITASYTLPKGQNILEVPQID